MRDYGELREIYRLTKIIRTPTYGIVSGYHTLPYICLGVGIESDNQTTEVRGTIHVSPRFLLKPSHYEPSYGDIFGEENVDAALMGRVFGFMGFRNKPVECKSDEIEVRHVDSDLDRRLNEVLDERERREDITTGVIVTPDSRYYPISVERFISSILEDEFNV